MAHAGGRPRIYDREKIARELLEWASLPTSLNLNKFCATRQPPLDPLYLLEMCETDDEISRACRTAKGMLASNREEANSRKELTNQAYSSNHRVYDKFAEKQWKDEIKFEKNVEKELKKQDNAEINEKFENFVNQFESLKRNKDDSSINNETKS